MLERQIRDMKTSVTFRVSLPISIKKKQMSPSKKRIDIVLPFIIDDRHARCQG